MLAAMVVDGAGMYAFRNRLTLDGFKDQLVDLGMSEEQADCVIDEAVELGMSGETAPDMSAMQDIFATCDVDMTELGQS